MRALAVCLIVVLAIVLVGCTTGPTPNPESLLKSAAEGPQGGDARSGTESVEMPIAPSVNVSPSGSATSTAVNSNYRPQASNAVAGHLVTGFVASITAAELQALREDGALVSILKEMDWIHEQEPWDETYRERMDKLRADYAARWSALVTTSKTEPPKFPALTTLVVNGWIGGNAGVPERTPGPEEAKALPRLLTNVVSAARGEATLLGPEESREGDDEDDQ